jgi:opacity protein-like surface antigen
MKKAWKFLLLAAAVATLLALTVAPAALATGGGYAAGDLAYHCPFSDINVSTDFILHQLNPAYDAWGTAEVNGSDVGMAFSVRIVYANVDAASQSAYFAGPVVKARPGSLNSAWWYFAVGPTSDGPEGAIGKFITHKMALPLVTGKVDLGSIGGGFQPLISGWVWVN